MTISEFQSEMYSSVRSIYQAENDMLRKEHEDDLCKLARVLESNTRSEIQKAKLMEEMYMKTINELKAEIHRKDLELVKLRNESDVKSTSDNMQTFLPSKTNVPEILLIDDDQYLNMDNWEKKNFLEGYTHNFIRQDWYPDSQWYDGRKAHTIEQQIRDIMTYFLLRQKKYSFILVSGSGPKYKTLFEGERRNAFEYSVTSNGITKEWTFH